MTVILHPGSVNPADNKYSIQNFSHITDIPADQWNLCAGDENPFACHQYLSALEESGAVSAKTGYEPHHLAAYDATGNIAAVVPAYIKSNSDAEIGADMGWSLAHDRMCGPYYPKLQVETPFTPVPGSRFLIAPNQDKKELSTQLLDHLIHTVEEKELSSLHINFIDATDKEFLVQSGLLISFGFQFQWESRGQQDFDSFLQSLKGSKRQMIKRERREIKNSGLVIETLPGDAITSDLMTQFFDLYQDTYDRYETKSFLDANTFQIIRQTMPDRILLNTVRKEGILIAATLHFLGENRLFAQHWGCSEHIKFLHYETTYYRAIDYCLQNGLTSVQGGPGGMHKTARGYLPISTHQAHWFRNKEFAQAVQSGIEKKSTQLMKQQATLMFGSPYREDV